MREILIIKYYRRLLFRDERTEVWEKVVPVRTRCGIRFKTEEVSKEKAQGVIKENGLVLVRESRYGKIWDAPDGSFREKYQALSDEERESLF